MPVRLFGSLAATLLLAAACAGEGEAEAGNEAAGENGARTFAQPSLTVETLEKIRTLIGEDLSKAFLVGDAEAAMALFNAHGDEEDRRQGSIHRALDREFHAQRYTRFELAELEPEEQLPSKECRARAGPRPRALRRGARPGTRGAGRARSPRPP